MKPIWGDSKTKTSPASLCCGPWARHIYPSLVLVLPRKTRPCLSERLLMWRKASNQTNKSKTKINKTHTVHKSKKRNSSNHPPLPQRDDCNTIKDTKNYTNNTRPAMFGFRGGGDRASRPPPPWKITENIGFLSNTGPDTLKNHKATHVHVPSQH